jgi:hypothetical protein
MDEEEAARVTGRAAGTTQTALDKASDDELSVVVQLIGDYYRGHGPDDCG